jgi:hypothetical protein
MNSEGPNYRFLKWLMLNLFLLIVIMQLFGEKIPYNDGAGWDGLAYRDIAYDFSAVVQKDGYNQYLIQRILPFVSLHYLFLVLDFPFHNNGLMTGMLFLNFLALLLGIHWYFKLALHLELSAKVQILGFILLFVNFPVLKVTWYEPFVTDLFAFVIGIGQLGFFVRNKKRSLLLLSLLSGFVWPTAFLIGMILLFLPSFKAIAAKTPVKFDKYMWLLLALGISTLVFGFYRFSTRPDKPFHELIRHIGSLLAVFLVFFGIYQNLQLQLKDNLIAFFSKWKPYKIGLFLGIALIFYLVIGFLSNGQPAFGLRDFLGYLIVRPLQLPFNFLVNHFLYFGMLVPIALYYFRATAKATAQWGIKYLVVLLVLFVLGLNTESRMIINLIPFLFLPLILVLRKYDIQWTSLLVLAGVNLLLSKCWYTINAPGIAEAFSTYNTDIYLNFPAQRYFQHFGPWQHLDMYLIYLGGLVAALLLIKSYDSLRIKSHFLQAAK